MKKTNNVTVKSINFTKIVEKFLGRCEITYPANGDVVFSAPHITAKTADAVSRIAVSSYVPVTVMYAAGHIIVREGSVWKDTAEVDRLSAWWIVRNAIKERYVHEEGIEYSFPDGRVNSLAANAIVVKGRTHGFRIVVRGITNGSPFNDPEVYEAVLEGPEGIHVLVEDPNRVYALYWAVSDAARTNDRIREQLFNESWEVFD